MNEIKKARKLIKTDPLSDAAIILTRLVRALESDEHFDVGDLYRLSFDNFNLAIDILREWRLDRYYSGKAKLHDLSVQVGALTAESPALPPGYK